MVLTISSAALLGATNATSAPLGASLSDPIGAQIWHAHQFGPDHPMPSADMVTDPLVQAQRALTVDLQQGRTVEEWIDVADANRWLSLEASPRDADLAIEVARVTALVGATPDMAAIRASADAMPADLRAPFASLVATVADAYAAQLPLAGVEELSTADRDASLARAESIVAAMNAFRAALAEREVPLASTATPLFRDPNGLVILGGAGSDTWEPNGLLRDPVLMVDVGGDDVYHTTAGGACGSNRFHECNLVLVSVLLDVEGDDVYDYNGAPNAVQGAGSLGGIGLLVDVLGDDAYKSMMTRTNVGPSQDALAYKDGGSQGMSNAGVGIQIDGAGNDLYLAKVRSTLGRSVWLFSQGWGGHGGLGISADADGQDAWLGYGLGIPCNGPRSGRDCGFQGVYNDGVGFFGGVGIMADLGGDDDVYESYDNGTTTDYYSIGFGAFGGVGIFYEDGGDDDYAAGEFATNPWIEPLLNCAYGTGSLGGAGFFVEMGGDDTYYGVSGSPRDAYVMNEGFGGIGAGYGLFVDVSGDDGHFMETLNADGTGPNTHPDSDTFGRGVLFEHNGGVDLFTGLLDTSGEGGRNLAGNYLDLGGVDTYTGAAPSRDNARWSGGADLNAMPGIDIFGDLS